MDRPQFIQYLVHQKLLDVSQQKTLAKLSTNVNLCYYLVQQNLVPAKKLAEKLAHDFGLPYIELTPEPHSSVRDFLDLESISTYHALPIKKLENTLLLALSDPNNTQAIEAFRTKTNLSIKAAICPADQLTQQIQLLCNTHHKSIDADNVVALLDQLFLEAIEAHASDVHFEPYQDHYRIRFRIDGLLHHKHTLPLDKKNMITTRLKVLTHCDIAEQRLPQDGHFQLDHNHDCRLSTCPTVFGEKIVCRILNHQQSAWQIDDLGFNPSQLKLFKKALNKPQGLILVSGPTGSGKSMTLYAALNYLNNIEKNICSVEDPVEVQLPGINQVNVHPNIGLDFATVLKTFLRQDPDIIMIGEIRDTETAKIALRAAQTGHLVLATVHANSAQETIDRLVNMQTNRYALAQALTLIVAQRLLRKRCKHCPKKAPCTHCQQGYSGRMGIFEMIPFTQENKSCCANGQQPTPTMTLSQAAAEVIQLGLTDTQETKRVLCT